PKARLTHGSTLGSISGVRISAATGILIAAATLLTDGRSLLFSSYDPLALRLEAPLADLFAHAASEGYSVRGTLSYSDGGRVAALRDVAISVRGHTSRRESECSFPKLKIDFGGKGGGSTESTLFSG